MARSRGRRRGIEDHEEHFDEGWLVSYADMMTLLVALFMVLFSISSVNVSKFESLQRSLQAAFSGKIFPGGEALQQTGGDDHSPKLGDTQPPPTFAPGRRERSSAAERRREEQELAKLRKRIDAAARGLGLAHKVKTSVTKDGLRVRLLTDDLLFASGQAVPSATSLPLLARLGDILGSEGKHPVVIEGHTDSVSTAGTRFATNWELSTERATSIVRAFAATGVVQRRMTAAGRAHLDPVAGNDTSTGRSLNRRVEILLPRMARPTP